MTKSEYCFYKFAQNITEKYNPPPNIKKQKEEKKNWQFINDPVLDTQVPNNRILVNEDMSTKNLV